MCGTGSDNVTNSYIDSVFQFLINVEFSTRHSWKMFKSAFSNGLIDMVFWGTSFTLNFSMLFNFYRCIFRFLCAFIDCFNFNLGHFNISTERCYYFKSTKRPTKVFSLDLNRKGFFFVEHHQKHRLHRFAIDNSPCFSIAKRKSGQPHKYKMFYSTI